MPLSHHSPPVFEGSFSLDQAEFLAHLLQFSQAPSLSDLPCGGHQADADEAFVGGTPGGRTELTKTPSW